MATSKKVSRKLSKKLILKSSEAFLLALELYNKPTINYRAESFSILFSNSWELLMKSYIYQQNGGKKLSIFRRKKRNQKRESITLDECLNKIFSNQNDPVKRNIQYISEIRNEAAHLIINELDPYFSRAFQTGVSNYVRFLFDWFGVNLNDKLNPGLISLITDKNKLPDIGLLKTKYSKEDFKSILNWIKKFEELEKLGPDATISIRHTIAIVRNPRKAEFVLSSGKTGYQEAVILEKLRDPDISHPYSRTMVLAEIQKRMPGHIRFTTYDIEARAFVIGCKKNNNDYFYRGGISKVGQYSRKFVDEFIEAINIDDKNLKSWRKQYGQCLKNLK
jgi:hypothetical protein